mgnify:CR=1 FL=1
MPATSKAQQRFMGMVYAAKKGKKAASPEVAAAAKGMTKKEAKKFAKTKMVDGEHHDKHHGTGEIKEGKPAGYKHGGHAHKKHHKSTGGAIPADHLPALPGRVPDLVRASPVGHRRAGTAVAHPDGGRHPGRHPGGAAGQHVDGAGAHQQKPKASSHEALKPVC